MKNVILSILILSIGTVSLTAQIFNTTDTIYGNEWIDFSKSYVKIKVGEDGIYKVSKQPLEAAGFPVNSVQANRFQLFYLGEEIPIRTSTNGILGNADYFEFYGQQNRSQLDQHLFKNPEEEMLNPDYGLFTDSSAYFLTWTDTGDPTARFTFQNNNPNPGLTPEPWFWETKKLNFHSTPINKRYDNQFLVAYSHFDEAEGFAGSFSKFHQFDLDFPSFFDPDPDASVHIRMVSDPGDHELEIRLDGEVLNQSTPGSYELLDFEFPIANNQVDDLMALEVEGFINNSDRYAVAMIDWTYKKSFDFEDQSVYFFSFEGSNAQRYFEIQQVDLDGNTLLLYDLTNETYLEPAIEGANVTFVLPASAQSANFCLVNLQTGIKSVSAVTPVTFENLSTSSSDYLIVTHSNLYNDGTGNNYVEEYANYRRSMQGGGYDVQVIEVNQLYDQFGYGIEKHSFGLRSFFNFVYHKWPVNPTVLLLGHGFAYDQIRDESSPFFSTHFVPTFGSPGSDNLLLSTNETDAPLLPVGRVAARTPEEISIYLEKVKTYEQSFNLPRTVENLAWRKRLLHLVGGDPGEQDGFQFYLDNLKDEIENNGFGGQVNTVKKTNSGPIQTSISDAVIEAVNEGIVFKTFLGHGAVVNTDFGLDDPEIFDNGDRLMTVLSLGCLTGNLYDEQNSVSERFLFEPNRGAIAYIASSGFAYPNVLGLVTEEMYRLIGEELYGATLGEWMQVTRAAFEDQTAFSVVTYIQQLSFHGDPAIRLNRYKAPDYVVDPASVAFTPSIIDAQEDSFRLNFEVVNLGYFQKDTIVVRLERTVGGNLFFERLDTVVVEGPEALLNYTLPVLGEEGRGINTLLIELDVFNQTEELPFPQAENNNELVQSNGKRGIDFFVIDNNAYPVFPPEFGILTEPELTLVASTTNAFAPLQKYLIEIDTTEYFNSSLLRRTEKMSEGGIIQWKPDIPLKDERVFYWRISVDSTLTSTPGYNWNTSSFVFLPGRPKGWNQSHFFQYQKNDLTTIALEEPGREFAFANTVNNVVGEAMATTPANNDRSRYLINNDRILKTPGWFNKNLTVVVLDPETGQPWENAPGGLYGSFNGGNPMKGFVFQFELAEKRKAVMDFIRDVVPSGHYVMLYTFHRNGNSFVPEEWAADSITYGENLFQVLEDQGAQLVRQLEDKGSVPYIFAFIKDQEVLGEAIAQDEDERVNVIFSMPVSWNEGKVTSRLVGPAKSWASFEWQTIVDDDPNNDNSHLNIYGINQENNEEVLLLEDLPEDNILLGQFDAEQYPYLRLEYEVQDTIDRTTPHIAYWRVFYEGLGDAAVAPNIAYSFERDTLNQGEDLRLNMAFMNAGDDQLDSLLVGYSIQDAQNNVINQSERYIPLALLDTLVANFTFDSRYLSGNNRLVIEANPNNDQPELYRFNNVAVQDFYVKEDEKNPLLDVTFDGIHILDGDLVSAKPFVVVALRDENPYLPLTDTASIEMTLTYPDGSVQPLRFSDPTIQFFPASGSKNEARVEWEPQFKQSGLYYLRVNGRDASDNEAGSLDYEVSFEVITKRMISNVLPYPNPFSTACRFIYTLTGDKSPDYFKIQIMTVSGRIVKEITQEEFGLLKVGTHQSDYVWDGTDTYGNQLANGVYLYRVIARNQNDGALERYETAADRFFKKDFGKLVIMR